MYVCAFRGRRDSYEVPVALAEGSLLDQLITDAYLPSSALPVAHFLPSKLREIVESRREDGIPEDRVECLWGTTAREWYMRARGKPAHVIYSQYDPVYSRAAADRARANESDLLLYTPYAWEAFRADYDHQPNRVLFQYHPHSEHERSVLSEDIEQFPEVEHSYKAEIGEELPEASRRRVDDAWQHADQIICASTFTRRTLIEAGADPTICSVIPYGISPQHEPSLTPKETFHVLFVGSGVQRKGLHHLLYAWEQASLPVGSRLTLVCRVIDPGIAAIAHRLDTVHLIRGVPLDELHELYRTSTLFAMPSLIEGFGQVYLESLSFGCPVLGTSNTCLPDLGNEKNGVYVAPPADIAALAERLEQLGDQLPRHAETRHKARECALQFSWPRFRKDLRHVLGQRAQ